MRPLPALALLVLVAGCTTPTPVGPGSSTHPEDSGTATAATATASSTSTLSSSASSTMAPVAVHLAGTSFSPSSSSVAQGGALQWIVDSGTHTVTVVDGNGTVYHNREGLGAGAQDSYTFAGRGVYTVYCKYHRAAGMTSTVTVG